MKNYAGTEESLWAATVSKRYEGAAIEEDARCDVAVIGAGFTGLRAALDLAEGGARVVVVDAGGVGWGASGRNGGQVNPMLPVYKPDDLLRAVGARYFERLAAVSLGSADAAFDLIRKHRIDCDARQKGWLRVDHCAKARETARKGATLWSGYGADFRFVDGEEVTRLSGSPAYVSGILAPKGGAVHPLSLVCGLAFAAEAAGARIFERTAVEGLERRNGGWVLTCGAHTVAAEQVILATNGYSGALRPDIARTVVSVTSIQMGTDSLPDAVIADILPGGQTISDTRRSIMYSRREPQNRFVYGGASAMGFDGKPYGFETMRRDAERTFPQLKGVAWRYRWGGQIALTRDRIPRFMEPEPGLLAGLGYNGRGVAMSLVMGRVLADRALGRAADDLPFPVSKPDPMAFKRIQEFGAGLALAAMRIADNREMRAGR